MRRAPLLLGAFGALALALSPMAAAQLKKAPSPVGKWEFKTAEMKDRCTISGEMQIEEVGAGETRRFVCKFRAVQACTAGEIRTIHTDQTCKLTQAGPKITIFSKVERIVSTDPPELMKGMDRRYAPDNFAVTIDADGDEMNGLFESVGEAPVKFRRKGDMVS